jgi:citrate lyase beta subunit
MGFGTKHAIHPNQIPVINDAFSPTKDEIEWAKKIKDEFESPESKDKGVIGIESNMIDRPVYLNALRILRDSE